MEDICACIAIFVSGVAIGINIAILILNRRDK